MIFINKFSTGSQKLYQRIALAVYVTVLHIIKTNKQKKIENIGIMNVNTLLREYILCIRRSD